MGLRLALINDKGQQIKEAGPSMPVAVLGLSDVADAGDDFVVAPEERVAPTVARPREHRQRRRSALGRDAHAMSSGARLEDIFEQIQAGEAATLNIVLKADVTGSLEALTESLRKLERDDVKLAFVHRAVGGITENDIQLAAASNATIIGFNVRPDRKARDMAEAEHVEVRTYEIIYKLLEDIEKAMVGMLAPEFEEVVTGNRSARIFSVPRVRAHCRLLRAARHDHPWLEGALPPRWHDHLEGHDHLAEAFQGRRARGADRLRVRHRAVRLPRSEVGRHHRNVRGTRDPTHVGSLAVDLRLPESHSLKEKRAVVKTILQGALDDSPLAAAEVDHQDKWRRAEARFAAVAGSESHVREVLEAVERFVWSFPEIEVVDSSLRWMESE